jgi:hypothetical protein
MAICYPDYDDITQEGIQSHGEVLFYEACKQQLSNDFHVFHSVSWISRHSGDAKDGEADFLICHPDRGFVVVEIKGGRINANQATGIWTSTDENDQIHKLRTNPFKQASSGKYNILSKVKEHRDWPKLGLKWINAGHAAFFPNVDDGRVLQGPEAPVEIIGDRGDLQTFAKWVDKIFNYWSSQGTSSDNKKLGPSGIQIFRKIFARVVEARPLLSSKIAGEELERLKLTTQQIQILDLISRQRRVAISGGAGTGKTVLALEKARRLAGEGFNTLLTCYNAPLAEHLGNVSGSEENLTVLGFHKLCKQMVDRASEKSERNLVEEAKGSYPGMDLWDHHYPIALAYALEILDERYDAIVVDEGQDFGEEFWFPIEILLNDSEKSPLYIFYDENQNVYTRASTFPTDVAPITLTVNCRNTRQIHAAAYHFYSGAHIDAPSIEGEKNQTIEAPSTDKQSKKIYEMITRLIMVEKISASSITVLIADRIRRKSYQGLLTSFTLPSETHWGPVDDLSQNNVKVETVARFKGLESDILILWGLDSLPEAEKRETLYVGMSRAKSLLFICGTKATCDQVLNLTQ